MFTPIDLPISADPDCGTDDVMILMAQSVPSATAVPCLAAIPAGWEVGGLQIKRGRGRFQLEAGDNVVEVALHPPDECAVDAATEIASDQAGMRRFEAPEQLPPALRATRTYVFPGGCVTYRFEFGPDGDASLIHDVDAALAFQPRVDLVREVDERSGGLSLCGADAPPCVGED